MTVQTIDLGQRAEFAKLVKEHKNAVYAVAYSSTGDGYVSEDVAQEAFLQAWHARNTLREPSRFRAWVCGIARNIARNEHRRRRRRPEHELTDDSIGTRPDAEDVVLRKERLALLWQALSCIDEKYRVVLSLYYQQGKSSHAVAVSLGIREELVNQRLRRGRELLKNQVSEMLLEDLKDLAPTQGFSQRVMGLVVLPAAPTGFSTGSVTPRVGGTATTLGKAMAMNGTKWSIGAVLVVLLIGATSLVIKSGDATSDEPPSATDSSAMGAASVKDESPRNPASLHVEMARPSAQPTSAGAPHQAPNPAENKQTFSFDVRGDKHADEVWYQLQEILPACANTFFEDSDASYEAAKVHLSFIDEKESAKLGKVDVESADATEPSKSRFERCISTALQGATFAVGTEALTVGFKTYVQPAFEAVDPDLVDSMPDAVGGAAEGPSRGAQDAPVTLVVYTDFMCSYCSRVLGTMDELLDDYENKIRIVTKLYPLKPSSRRLAEATVAAGMQDAFWPMHDQIFASQNGADMTDATILAFATHLGLDLELFEKDWKSHAVAAVVQRDLDDGKALGVRGTPATFVNKQLIEGAQPIENFFEVIEAALAP